MELQDPQMEGMHDTTLHHVRAEAFHGDDGVGRSPGQGILHIRSEGLPPFKKPNHKKIFSYQASSSARSQPASDGRTAA